MLNDRQKERGREIDYGERNIYTIGIENGKREKGREWYGEGEREVKWEIREEREYREKFQEINLIESKEYLRRMRCTLELV